MNITTILKWTGKAVIAGILSLVILSGFVLVYNYTGVHITSQDGATDYTWESGQLKSTMKEGFSWVRMDENGYNNSYEAPSQTSEDASNAEDSSGMDTHENPDILLMGSSHMEAAQVAADENTGYLLNELLPDYYTYNIGMSGHTLYTCVSNLAQAVAAYAPSRYILIETNDIELDISEMQSVIDGTIEELTSYDSGLMYSLQKYIPAAKALYQNIDEWQAVSEADSSGNTLQPGTLTVSAAENDPPQSDGEYIDTLNQFLAKARRDCGDATLIIFYQTNLNLYPSGEIHDTVNHEYLTYFEEACEENGIVFVDMTQAFCELYETTHRMPHGFSNTAVGVGHLNRYGHAVIAVTLASTISELDKIE